ncbi:DNA-processing protein DprA [Patescibacteria group bacterium]
MSILENETGQKNHGIPRRSAPRDDIRFWVGFSNMRIIGPTRFKKLYNYFSSMQQAWQASFGELRQAGLDEKTAEQILKLRKEIDLDLVMEKLAQEDISIINLYSDKYPKLLQEIYDLPAILYYRGTWQTEQDEFSLAIVGTRKISNYGKQTTFEITQELTQAGLVIVSGLALGVDALAHETCLKNKGRTIAVLGGGLDKECIYPSYNKHLAEKIIANGGLLVSEYPPGMRPLRINFPQRNRIVSGLCKGVLVTEAPEKSGALLTARNALDQNREVFAMPGSIYNINSLGPNNLIKMGAKLVLSAEDVLETLDLGLIKEFVETKKIVPDSKEEAEILKHLSHEPVHVDSLARLTSLETNVINSTMTLMEMKGRVKNLGGMMYVIN